MPTKISWTDEVWNVVVGCIKCSVGCKNCYAERMMYRQVCMGAARHEKDPDSDELAWIAYSDVMDEDTHGWNGNISLRYSELNIPLHWKKPRRIFVCSMGDLFHEKVPFEFILKVWKIIWRCPQHTFLVLTKRTKQMDAFAKWLFIEKEYRVNSLNLHLGVSISTQAEADEKIPILLQIPAAVRFVSLEPLLEKVKLNNIKTSERTLDALRGKSKYSVDGNTPYYGHFLDWVIIGCESINGRVGRLIGDSGDWGLWWEAATDIVQQCRAAGVPVFVKQVPIHGAIVSKNMAEWPEELQVQEYPK